MPSDKHNSIAAKDTGLIFSLFDVASAQQVSFDALQYMYVQSMLHGLTSVLLCIPILSLLEAQSVYRCGSAT